MRFINVENYGGGKALKCVRSTRKQQRNDNLSFPLCIQNNQQVKSHVNTCVGISLPPKKAVIYSCSIEALTFQIKWHQFQVQQCLIW